MAFLPPLPAAAARLQALAALRAKCAAPQSPSAASRIISRRQTLLSHYPPDVDVAKLAAQDHRLAGVGLIDTWKNVMEQREKAMALRGKAPRVSVVTGMAKKPEGENGKKKKRK
ncbi:hypothetical protein HDU87_004518 [Geranomyces variabilis]|uniref:Uncharacterized protein n=1 Tax=Geranomyces variabilis TaxID=109894 RepID=A0AAD5TJD3_9FUNG|nr:hypothetical protein HDU87_004518 [Geranomyces variabilis]